MALSSNAPTLEYWLRAPGTHELKSQLGMQIHYTESPEQCLGVFSSHEGPIFVSGCSLCFEASVSRCNVCVLCLFQARL